MEVRHVPAGATDDEGRCLADTVEFAETVREKLRGLTFRDEVPEGYALVFEFAEPPSIVPDVLTHRRSIHMLFVKVPLDVIWVLDGEVRRVSTLSPWTGFGLARADTIVELPAGAATGVEVGDAVRLVEDGAERTQ